MQLNMFLFSLTGLTLEIGWLEGVTMLVILCNQEVVIALHVVTATRTTMVEYPDHSMFAGESI